MHHGAQNDEPRRRGFLAKRKDVNFVVPRQALDQCEESRDHALLAAPVDPPGHDEPDLHGWVRRPYLSSREPAHIMGGEAQTTTLVAIETQSRGSS